MIEIGPEDGNPYGISLYKVDTPSGSQINLQTVEEAQSYENRRDRYLTDNIFTNVSDIQDLDRLLMFEILVYRWSLWMGQGFDYMNSRVDESALKNAIKEYSQEVRQVKQSLGIDKSTRDKDKGSNLAEYTSKLLERAKVFGYHRNEQYELVVSKFYELRSMISTYDRCDSEERETLDLSQDSIFEWIREKVISEFDAHSEEFRKSQAIWIREM
jgi:hypothetical protein